MKQSAGLLLYRTGKSGVEVLLAHSGGPFWAKKDQGAWSIPKGEFVDDEDPLSAAKREFQEELGHQAPEGKYTDLGQVKIPGKIILAWAIEANFDTANIQSNTFEMEWPPRSGQKQEFPEVDKASWVKLNKAPEKMHKGQAEFIERLSGKLGLDINESLEDKTSSQQSLF